MKQPIKLDRIVFLSVPDSLRGSLESTSDFTIDPAIPLPAEIPAGEDTLNLENLSWEMILSGMIRVVAADPQAEDADYYRRFVLAVKPDLLAEFSEAAILKARNGDYDLALDILGALSGLYPGEPLVQLNIALVHEDRADALERAGREAEADAENDLAQGIYAALLDQREPFANALFNAGFFYMKRRHYERARACFESFLPVADDPRKKARARSIIKQIAGHALDDEEFRETYELIRGGSEEQGIEHAREFITRHPEVWNGWFLLGWGLRRLARWQDGALAFRKAQELGGDNSDTRNELAICLMESGDLKAARTELEGALRLESDNIKVISNLGVLAMRAGDTDEAAAFFRTVLELEPADQPAAAYLAQLRQA